MKFPQIKQDSTLNCDQKLDKIQDLIKDAGHPLPGSFYYISNIFENCVSYEHTKCLKTAYQISVEANIIPTSNLGRGLEAIGGHDINAVNQYIIMKVQCGDIKPAHNLAPLIPHLYRGQEDELSGQMQDWYDTYSYFFFRAIEIALRGFLEESSGHGAEDFSTEIQPIKAKLEDIAQSEGLDPNDAYQDKDFEIVRVYILLDDLKWVTKNNVDWSTLQSNISEYSHLELLLNHNTSAVPSLQQHNTHPLTKLLRYPFSPSQVNAVADDPNATNDEAREAKQSLGKIQKLAYYDHCVELIAPEHGQNDDPTARLRDELLARKSFDSTIAEIEVFNALRREFGVANVAIEQQAPNGGVPDATITAGGETIWVEVTLPQPQPSYEVAQHYSTSMNPQESEARANVTKKLRSQIRDVKEATGDRTMLVVKNEESRLDNEIVGEYVEGGIEMAVPMGDSDGEPILFRGDPGLQYDNVPDHLDILVNFDTLHDLSGPPYIEGQVANLTDVGQSIISRLSNAFNAVELKPS
ncbi:hypothetical protein [Halocatena pleomorpha]|uniref:Uncharacterized protein n=1 Tax=Halocatena pleomorpha TaxID=1785090 RepID=A0A3P3RB18_9EURY|nr:hypothetical protein [Halocatena pleomorpha]RRJ30646.1 hypothetical protein EIK79_09195 [Halocatena pleomorpha]